MVTVSLPVFMLPSEVTVKVPAVSVCRALQNLHTAECFRLLLQINSLWCVKPNLIIIAKLADIFPNKFIQPLSSCRLHTLCAGGMPVTLTRRRCVSHSHRHQAGSICIWQKSLHYQWFEVISCFWEGPFSLLSVRHGQKAYQRWSRPVSFKKPESTLSETETRPSKNALESKTKTKNLKKWSQDQDRSRVLQHCWKVCTLRLC